MSDTPKRKARMTVNNNKKDTHIYNIINNPPREFTEPCEACGVSEFYLGVKHAEEHIMELVKKHEPIWDRDGFVACVCGDETGWLSHFEELIKGEQK